jgi:CubicO group peptidase (beta-lactamase class C family)
MSIRMVTKIPNVIVGYHGTNMKKLLALITLFASGLAGQEMPRTAPEEVGMSAERLARIDEVLEKTIARKDLAGAVTIIARQGKIAHVGTYGMANVEDSQPMKPDTLFRIASMSKAITSVAVMMLYEEGKFMLGEPVGKYLPEWKSVSVLPGPEASNNYRVPAKRPITIRHLLTHTSGLTYHWNAKLGELYDSYDMPHGLGGPSQLDLAEASRQLAQLPLLFHPGDRYEYGLSIDVLGRLVEVTSGQTLDEFLRERIFEPLGMKDTHFYLPAGKEKRMAAVYTKEKDGTLKRQQGDVPVGDGQADVNYPYQGPKRYFSGGGGLSSTAIDYARFAQMILNKGELDGKRLLSPTTVKLMTMDHVQKITKDRDAPSFGLGFYIENSELGFRELTSDGTHGWAGFWYTLFFISPEEDMIGIFMAQQYPASTNVSQQFMVLAHQAIVE